MAFQAQRAEVREIAFSTAFDYGDDVVRVPKAAAKPLTQVPSTQVPFRKSFVSAKAAQLS